MHTQFLNKKVFLKYRRNIKNPCKNLLEASGKNPRGKKNYFNETDLRDSSASTLNDTFVSDLNDTVLSL